MHLWCRSAARRDITTINTPAWPRELIAVNEETRRRANFRFSFAPLTLNLKDDREIVPDPTPAREPRGLCPHGLRHEAKPLEGNRLYQKRLKARAKLSPACQPNSCSTKAPCAPSSRMVSPGSSPRTCATSSTSITRVKAVGRIDDDERGTTTVRTPGGPQEVLTVNESGVYALIFTSRKPEAKRFRKWVTSEVLPAIRRTGRYETSDPRFPQQDASTVERQRKLLEQALADATLIDHRLQVAIAHWLHQIHVDPHYGPTRDEYTFVKFVNALREANVLAGLLLDYPRRPTHELSDADRPESPRNIQ